MRRFIHIDNIIENRYGFNTKDLRDGGYDMKNYVRPEMMIETFMADEFVSACDDKGVTYTFVCNGGQYGKSYDVWIDDGDGVFNSRKDDKLTSWLSYGPCGKDHQVTVPRGTSVSNVFQEGWMRPYNNANADVEKVIVWTNNSTNCHCSANLSIKDWGKNRS